MFVQKWKKRADHSVKLNTLLRIYEAAIYGIGRRKVNDVIIFDRRKYLVVQRFRKQTANRFLPLACIEKGCREMANKKQ